MRAAFTAWGLLIVSTAAQYALAKRTRLRWLIPAITPVCLIVSWNLLLKGITPYMLLVFEFLFYVADGCLLGWAIYGIREWVLRKKNWDEE